MCFEFPADRNRAFCIWQWVQCTQTNVANGWEGSTFFIAGVATLFRGKCGKMDEILEFEDGRRKVEKMAAAQNVGQKSRDLPRQGTF